MLLESELIGVSIINQSAINLGYSVENAIYSSNLLRLLGFSLKSKARKSRNKHCIQWKRIIAFSKEGIVIASEREIILPKQIPDIHEAYLKKIEVMGMEIKSQEGVLIGIVKDIVIADNNGNIMGFIASEGLLTDLIDGYSYLPRSKCKFNDAFGCLTVEDDFEDVLIHHPLGGLKKILGIDITNQQKI
ncbi:PRC-barrel domain-containing protein [Alkaliphilus peptidifermentans]|uniref:Uncharacterized protein YrrD, contains PRC-barrel domain n=1 Tax=Alkaliphilus peptidifermentans DSM 18978 TaxID=1120976 RepID=A0A1G5H2X6_9FIRM|nr:hypothetical protein [Alkaliphilus peptidifermentans]SCY58232.1 Uncharacterized protein YrrD, contains PRC-barrel domain [Alkaliphilus peptidifermentans DSM 18978]